MVCFKVVGGGPFKHMGADCLFCASFSLALLSLSLCFFIYGTTFLVYFYVYINCYKSFKLRKKLYNVVLSVHSRTEGVDMLNQENLQVNKYIYKYFFTKVNII